MIAPPTVKSTNKHSGGSFFRIFKKFFKSADFVYSGGGSGTGNLNLKEFFDFDHRKVPYEGIFLFEIHIFANSTSVKIDK